MKNIVLYLSTFLSCSFNVVLAKITSFGLQSKEEKVEPTVIANGNAVLTGDGSGESPPKHANTSAHAYEDPEALAQNPKDINAALTNGMCVVSIGWNALYYLNSEGIVCCNILWL